MRVLEPENRVRTGVMAVVIAVLATLVGQSFTSVPMLFEAWVMATNLVRGPSNAS